MNEDGIRWYCLQIVLGYIWPQDPLVKRVKEYYPVIIRKFSACPSRTGTGRGSAADGEQAPGIQHHRETNRKLTLSSLCQ
ncbi:MAG: hypothetical protein JRJ00_05265 [Deltaproteobacteria bacterium]|nr:hypothetical protein [Deltaproteobacteria bacterium]